MEVSPYLLAIQSLDGQNPGDKYKELHSIVAQIIKDDKEREEFISTGLTQRVQPAMLPHLRILVGNKLKLNNAVIEALKSDDAMIIRQALNAKWFYSSSNDIIHVDYFVSNVIPYISLRTRLELVKTLAHCLVGDSKKADDFFGSFADLFGVDQALPLLVACSENYIYSVVLERRITLPSRILGILYRKYPQLVIRYLQLGNERNEANKSDRKIHKISLANYSSFLPMLVKHHTQEFVELFESSPNYSKSMKLGSTRAEFFLRNATDVLIKKPRIFLNLLPLKLVSNKLSTQQFETMFENLFLKDVKDFAIEQMISYLQYYPQEKKFSLLTSKYKLLYGENILENYNTFACENFYKLLPTHIKEEYGKRKLESYVGQRQYHNYIFCLPPIESLRMLKERIKIPSDISRSEWIRQMIKSCAIYDSKEDLLDVLNYYYTHHMNEQAYVLHEVLDSLTDAFDIKSLSKVHWQVLKQIIRVAYTKGDLFATSSYQYAKFFKGALHYFLKQHKLDTLLENNEFLDLLVKIIVECYVEHDMKWNFITDCPEFERVCLQKFLLTIPDKYPETFKIWSNNKIKLNVTSYLIKSMHDFNVRRHYFTESNRRYNTGTMDFNNKENKRSKFTIKDYPWLINFSADLIKTGACNRIGFKQFRKILRTHDLEFYQKLIDDDPNLINDVESSDAIVALKRDQKRILNKWNLYMEACKEKLQTGNRFAKCFVLAIRWYQEIPVKFMKQCFLELESQNSILILGILLEGEAFGKVIEPYLPTDKKINIECKDAKNRYNIISSLTKAINFSNPPVPFDVIASFCQGDYVALATNTLTNVAQRLPIDKVLAYANQLIDKPISVKKLGIRMVFQVATNSELREFLMRMWTDEKNLSIRELVAIKIYDTFKKSPSDETWRLLKACFDGITSDDETILQNFSNLEDVDMNFMAMHIKEFINKVDSFIDDALDEQKKQKWMCFLVSKIDESIMQWLSEELITDIIQRNFFSYSIIFTVKIYLLSDMDRFEQRLKIIMDILRNEFEKFNISSRKSSRYYPANYHINTFFSLMFKQLLDKGNNEMSARVIDDALKLFSTILHPCQDAQTFIALSMYKNYYEAETPKEFGIKFGRSIVGLVNEFKSDIIVSDIVKIMNEFLNHANVYKCVKKLDLKLIIIKGLMESDERYGTLVGIKLIDYYEISHYNNSYDELMKIWKGIDNITVKAVLNNIMNKKVYFS
ncbi:PREDICTED: uncharacterized protein LOC105365600 [Ceratosolen solmsi marchali]|uniref:Uncharacterized protein LOC105365600 n=1 Tax=Ceratosolen solmsi marchali TaxID=326594 RepID=A0AAJ7DZG3_9HYME|nr:PREDICTED: uncharacterized protein LOC105365600 [Ceratosolen solmsi marchali]XP_011502113.1 PREDICTED: uncharacterized protein LOC105365600 [Ceratosolen solmsi marchali]